MAISINSAWDAKLYQERKEKSRKSINSAWDAQKHYETYGGNGQSGNWNSPNRNVGKYGYTYNPKTHSWDKSSYSSTSYTETPKTTPTKSTAKVQTSYDSSTLSNSGGGGSSSSSSGGGSGVSAISQTGVVNPNSSASTDSKTSAEKQYIDIEFNTLTGECVVLPTKDTMKLKVGDTVTIKGIGKYLSGLFFISEIKRTISNSGGYSMSLTLIRNGFGDSLKKAKAKVVVPAPVVQTNAVDTSKNIVNNSFKVGDKVKIVGDDAVYSNACDGMKVPEWVKQKVLTVDGLSVDGKRARVNPIWSWTYVKYLRHV